MESVKRAHVMLNTTYAELSDKDHSLDGKWDLVREVIVSYNKDSFYASSVYDIMDIISARIDETYRPDFDKMWDE
jgi:hypothetical protein